uniref:Uncharacterized protein n=1 Tax=Arundo donax TaxID=35708 RepID=A0A0A9C7V8_ARUDO
MREMGGLIGARWEEVGVSRGERSSRKASTSEKSCKVKKTIACISARRRRPTGEKSGKQPWGRMAAGAWWKKLGEDSAITEQHCSTCSLEASAAPSS